MLGPMYKDQGLVVWYLLFDAWLRLKSMKNIIFSQNIPKPRAINNHPFDKLVIKKRWWYLMMGWPLALLMPWMAHTKAWTAKKMPPKNSLLHFTGKLGYKSQKGQDTLFKKYVVLTLQFNYTTIFATKWRGDNHQSCCNWVWNYCKCEDLLQLILIDVSIVHDLQK